MKNVNTELLDDDVQDKLLDIFNKYINDEEDLMDEIKNAESEASKKRRIIQFFKRKMNLRLNLKNVLKNRIPKEEIKNLLDDMIDTVEYNF
jgi:hypothetical protein